MSIKHALALTLCVALPGAASAVDGVLEISETCAVNTGCFAGDAAGYPVTISDTGSYRLTSDLLIPDVNTTAISVEANDVSIDLNGFSIVQSSCVGASTASCVSGSGTGSGVDATVPHEATMVHNGSIVGMGDDGVDLNAQSRVENLHVRWNAGDGIDVVAGSEVSGCLAFENTGRGIYGSGGVTISNNTVRDNGGNGIDGGVSGSLILENISNSNGGDGIVTSGTSYVRENIVRSNIGFGLDLASDTPYIGNVIDNNFGGTVDDGLALGVNVCDGSGTCP